MYRMFYLSLQSGKKKSLQSTILSYCLSDAGDIVIVNAPNSSNMIICTNGNKKENDPGLPVGLKDPNWENFNLLKNDVLPNTVRLALVIESKKKKKKDSLFKPLFL